MTESSDPPRADQPTVPIGPHVPPAAVRARAGAPRKGGGLPRTPEYRWAVNALRGLRQELVRDAAAYRPLPPASAAGSFVRRLPAGPRRWAAWLPHAVVAWLALITFLIGYAEGEGDFMGMALLTGLVPAATVLLTLIRPVAAFWCSLGGSLVLLLLSDVWGHADPEPWLAGTLAAHLIVLTVVALRTGPRAAAWMWVLSAVYAIVASGVQDEYGTYGEYDSAGSNAVQTLITAAVLLLCVALRHIRRSAQQEVSAERHASAAERSRRTLLEERTTIARELHDVVAHHMSVVAIQAEAAPYRVENPPPELAQAFATIRENAVAALAELRRLLGVVRAEDYQAPDAPQPTLSDLEALLANVREAGLDVQKTVTGAVRELPQGVELSAYRIVQEALSNVLRHAPGASAKVEISHVLGGLGLRVVNGPATGAPAPSPGAGHGVTGMRERVSMLGGQMTAEPAADGGYEVTAFLPAGSATEDAGAGGGAAAGAGGGGGRQA